MADHPKKKGRDRDLVSDQEHEVAYLMRTAKVTRQKALQAIRKAGSNVSATSIPRLSSVDGGGAVRCFRTSALRALA
ncbi:DUF3606 domain-containing protein [Sinorhizobium medicae]|nr:DUF3606 domain-containing protein [Sinorhizobium medicae]